MMNIYLCSLSCLSCSHFHALSSYSMLFHPKLYNAPILVVILEFLSAKLLQGFFGNKKIANDTDNSSRKNKEKIAETLIK